jgi:hypothetical protein
VYSDGVASDADASGYESGGGVDDDSNDCFDAQIHRRIARGFPAEHFLNATLIPRAGEAKCMLTGSVYAYR